MSDLQKRWAAIFGETVKVVDDKNQTIAILVQYNGAKKRYDVAENAELIAAIPTIQAENTRLKELNREMVAALQEISFEYKEYGRIMGKATVEKMEVILAKAEG